MKAYEQITIAVNEANKEIKDKSKEMKAITYQGFIKRLEKEAAKSLVKRRKGNEKANKLFKTNKLPQKISLILQRVEADHTKLDLFIFDRSYLLPLGRPWVTVILDYKSKSILGFYIGFDNPSYLSIARALRHAIQPKNYLKELYPEIKNEWPCYGIPMILAVDRGKDFESISFMDACADLNCRIQRNPARHPWYKGSVESYFKSMNERLLNDMKGKVFPNIIDSNDYNPKKNAIIDMELFMRMFHIWVVDIYQRQKVSKGTIIPYLSWEEDLDKVHRRVMPQQALEITLYEKRTKQHRDKGILLDFL